MEGYVKMSIEELEIMLNRQRALDAMVTKLREENWELGEKNEQLIAHNQRLQEKVRQLSDPNPILEYYLRKTEWLSEQVDELESVLAELYPEETDEDEEEFDPHCSICNLGEELAEKIARELEEDTEKRTIIIRMSDFL
jgi:ABC-type enterochelin transport system substrate-binding protein